MRNVFEGLALFIREHVLPFKNAMSILILSLGDQRKLEIQLDKTEPGSDYDMTIKPAGYLDIEPFLKKFSIDVNDMIDFPDLETNLGLTTLRLSKPNIKGVFSVGKGFEVIAEGQIEGKDLWKDEVKNFFLIVQDFKDSFAEESEKKFAKPVAAIFARQRSKS